MEAKLNVNDFVIKDDEGNVSIPYTVSIRLINKYNLKAVARIQYAGIIIDDIRVIANRRGTFTIDFPSRAIKTKDGDTKFVHDAFPCVPDVSRAFNAAILSAYQEAVEEAEKAVTENAA